MMLTLTPQLAQRFRDLSVRMEVADRNTVLLRQVPTNAARFNHPQTTLLVKRPHAGMPYVVCVSSELEYIGVDPGLTRVFRAGIPKEGWRTLLTTIPPSLDLAAAMNEGLAVIGFDGTEPRLPVRGTRAGSADGGVSSEGEESPIDRFGVDLLERWPEGPRGRTVGRHEELLDAVSCVLSGGECRMPILVGPSGIGKTNLLRAISARIRELSPDRQVLVIHPGELAIGITFDGELENVFARLLRDAEERPGLILAIEHFELLLVSRVPRLLSEALDRGTLCLMGTMLPQFAGRLRPPLARRSRLIPLPEMDWLAVRTILIGAAESLAASLGVTIDPALVEVCRKAAADLPGVSPSREIALLESAVMRTRLAGSHELSADDLCHAAHRLRRETADDAT